MAIFNLIEKIISPNLSDKISASAPVGSIYDILRAVKQQGNFDNYHGIFKDKSASVDRLIIYRHNDLDGAGACAAVGRFLHSKDIEVIEIKTDYEKIFDLELKKTDEVWFVDYSFSKADNQQYLEKAMKTTEHVVWIDHHVSSVDIIKNNPKFSKVSGIVKDFKLSGALLTYMYLYLLQFDDIEETEIRIPEVIKYISDYDTFSFALDFTKEFFLGVSILDYNNNVLDSEGNLSPVWLELFNAENMIFYIDQGRIINQYNIYNDNEHMKYAVPFEFFGRSLLAINRRGNSFMFGDNYDKYDIVCPYYYDGKKYQYSLYADEKKAKELGFSCNDLAKKMNPNGGGHIGASGFSLEKNIFESDSENIKRVTSE